MKTAFTLLFLFSCRIVWAQLTIVCPHNRIVYQRSNQNEASVPVSGLCPPSANRIDVRFEAIHTGQGVSTGWITVDPTPQNGRFQGMVPVKGGWYRLSVRAFQGSDRLAESTVDRVGVGEVFVVAGQSNALGGFESNPGAQDDRVSVVDWRNENLPEANLPLTFSQAATNRNMAPYNPLHMWGLLGDRLVNRLNVPVLFLGAAYGGTNSEVWRQSAQGQNPGGAPGLLLMPYRAISAALDHYIRRTGIRAVLWHQGESDNGYRGQQAYFDNVRAVIDKTRSQSGFMRLPWVVSRVSYIGGRTDAAIVAGQNQLIRELDQVWPGPETDAYTSLNDRFDGLHFGGPGLTVLTNLWDNSLNSDFFSQSTPGIVNALPPAITVGSIVPVGSQAGQPITVPFVQQEGFNADNQFTVKLFDHLGQWVGDLGTDRQDPATVRLPETIPTGTYTIQVNSTSPASTSWRSQPFAVTGQTPVTTNQPPVSSAGLIRGIRYEYDSPTHGFTLYVDADGPVEVKMQRLNGSFTNNAWGAAVVNSLGDSYNYSRFYAPVAVGIGGVEPGQYLISARRIGQPATERGQTVVLAHGTQAVYPVASNQNPIATQAIATQSATVGQAFSFSIPATTFSDPDGHALVYSAAGLPTGITIDRTTLIGIPVQMGDFPVTLRATDPGGLQAATSFIIRVSAPISTTTSTMPPVKATVVAGVRKVGYKYDAPTHGFQILVDADGLTEVRIERLDGAFEPSDWGGVTSFTAEPNYTAQRLYLPTSPGVGGVEAGRYRLSARLVGQPETAVTSEVVLQYGVFSVFTAPVAPPASTTSTSPSSATGASLAGISRLGYKYDAPTHGFQVLVNANHPVQISLERLDGPFGPTDWQSGTSFIDEKDYSFQRFYEPVSPGVGGVVSGTYRIKARLTNEPNSEVSVDVVLQYGVFQAYPPQRISRLASLVSEKSATGSTEAGLPASRPCAGCVRVIAQRENE